MRVVLKTLLWGILVLALIGLAAPAAIGWLLSTHFDRVVAHLSVPGYLKVVRSDFHRGWLHSRARIVLQPIGPLCHTRPCPVVVLHSRIDQGPLAWGARQPSLSPVLAMVRTRADLTTLWPRYVFSPNPGPLTVTSRIGFGTRGQATLELTGVTFDVARENPVAQVETATVSGQLTSGVMARRILGLSLDWPSFSLVRQTGGHLGWRHLDFRARPGPSGLLSRRLLTADSITLDNGQGHATRLRDLRAQTGPAAGGATALSLNIQKWVLPDNTQGTFLLAATEHGLPPAAWMALPGRWGALGGWSGGALNAPELYHAVLPGLLPAGSWLHFDRLELATPEGAVRVTANVIAPKKYKVATSADEWLSQLDARVFISLPAPILRRLVSHTLAPKAPPSAIDARLQMLIDRNLFTPENQGRRYVMHMKLAAGTMTINGRTRPKWRGMLDRLQAAMSGM